MEMKTARGSYVPGKQGDFEYVSGIEEIRQRVERKLQTVKGEFLPQPEFGSRLNLLSQIKPAKREAAARQYIYEALAEERDIELSSLALVYEQDAVLRLEMGFDYKGGKGFEIFTRI